jgi:hypothetical protein
MSDDDNNNKKQVEVPTKHPLEDVFDIEEGTTMLPKTIVQSEVVPYEDYDEKDDELDKQFQNIHDLALTAFEQQSEEAEIVDPKYKARNAEVAVQYLNTALQATNSKAQLKHAKDKLEVSKLRIGTQAAETGAQMDRNEILRMFAEQNKGKTNTYDHEADIEDGDIEETDD